MLSASLLLFLVGLANGRIFYDPYLHYDDIVPTPQPSPTSKPPETPKKPDQSRNLPLVPISVAGIPVIERPKQPDLKSLPRVPARSPAEVMGQPPHVPGMPQGPQSPPFGQNIWPGLPLQPIGGNKRTTPEPDTEISVGPFPGAPFPAPPPVGINGGPPDFAPPPPAPGFLSKVSDGARREFSRLIHNDSLTRAELKAEIFDWAQQQGEHILTEVLEYEKKETQRRDDIKKNITALLTSLPLAYEKYVTIKENEDLTRASEREQIRAFFEFLDDDVARVLQYITFSMGRPKPNHPDPLAPNKPEPGPTGPTGPSGPFVPYGGKIILPNGHVIITNPNGGNGGNGGPTIIWPQLDPHNERLRFL